MIDIFNIKLIFDEDVEMIGSESKYIWIMMGCESGLP